MNERNADTKPIPDDARRFIDEIRCTLSSGDGTPDEIIEERLAAWCRHARAERAKTKEAPPPKRSRFVRWLLGDKT